MRVLDRLTAVVALALVLVGLGGPTRAESPEPGAVVTAAQRSIVHGGPSVHAPDGWALRRLRPGASDAAPRPGVVVDVPAVTPDRPAPPPGDPRVVVARPAHLDAPPDARTAVSGGNCGDHRAGVVLTDGPDDLLPAMPVRLGGPADQVVSSIRYRSPAVPLPPRGTLPTRGPPLAT
ncbi:hypothetical protein [Micromonospora eburnea]|uniref:Uncharacterized protein n=1 Tax=Micromonospora eburnea TaxID=227316 RepID=A0A1C6VHS5_9ACTN|nr:hypothetical protein [Micromonospora eburnea]SCL65841.1 hypothetical protein GA0070604_5525 [Micromonospora eburnea]